MSATETGRRQRSRLPPVHHARPQWRRNGLRFAAAFLAVSVVFLLWPELDIAASALFHDAEARRFPLATTPVFKDLRDSVEVLTIAMAASVLLLLAAHFYHRRPIADRRGRTLIFFFLTLTVGPLLVVNITLKDNLGRARPAQTEIFRDGGTRFTPAFVPSAACPRNCSFVSGDVSAAFALLAIPFALRGTGGSRLRRATAAEGVRRRAQLRRWLILLIVGYGVFVGFLRLSVGAHFLSDVIISALLTVGVTALLFRLVVVDGLVWLPRIAPALTALWGRLWSAMIAALPGLKDFR